MAVPFPFLCNQVPLVKCSHASMPHLTRRHNKKRTRSHLVLKSWATRIRTLKMLESESSALPFGDSPLLSTDDIILQGFEKSKHFFQKFVKK